MCAYLLSTQTIYDTINGSMEIQEQSGINHSLVGLRLRLLEPEQCYRVILLLIGYPSYQPLNSTILCIIVPTITI